MEPTTILVILLIVIAALYLFMTYIPATFAGITWKGVVAFIVALVALAWLIWVFASSLKGLRL